MKKIALGLLCTVGTFGMSFAKDNRKEEVKQSAEGCMVRVDVRLKDSCGNVLGVLQNVGTREGTAEECADGGAHIRVEEHCVNVQCVQQQPLKLQQSTN